MFIVNNMRLRKIQINKYNKCTEVSNVLFVFFLGWRATSVHVLRLLQKGGFLLLS